MENWGDVGKMNQVEQREVIGYFDYGFQMKTSILNFSCFHIGSVKTHSAV